MKLVQLNLFVDSQETFDASCQTLCTFKLEENSIRSKESPKTADDYRLTYIYNEELKTILMLNGQ